MKKDQVNIIRFGFLYTIANVIQKGIGFLVFMYFASILSVKEYADFGLFYSFFSVICLFTYSGISESVIGSLKENVNKKLLFSSANTVYLIFSTAIIIFSIPLCYFFYGNDTTSIIYIFVIILSAICLSFFTFQSVQVRLEENHKLSIFYSFFPLFITYCLGFFLVYQTKKAIYYFEAGIFASIFFLLIVFLFGNRNLFQFSFNKEMQIKLIRKSMPYIAIAIVAWLLGYGNTFIINYLFDDFQVAIFVFLFTISSILQLIANSMNQVWSPRFYKIYDDSLIKSVESNYEKFTIYQGISIGVFSGLIIFIFPILIDFFSGLEKYSNVNYEFLFLFGGYIVSIPWWHAQNYYMVNNKGDKLMNLTLISGIFGFLIWLFLMIVLKEFGIYLGFFIQLLIRSLLVYFYAKKRWNIKFDWKGIVIGLTIMSLTYMLVY